MRTQLALLLGIARGPEMLVLDEPSEELDSVSIEILLQLLKDLASSGATIFFSSHQIGEVEQIADHVFIIDRGELLVGSSVDGLNTDYRRLQIESESPVSEMELVMEGVICIQTEGKLASVFVRDNLLERIRALRAKKVDVLPMSFREIVLQNLKAR